VGQGTPCHYQDTVNSQSADPSGRGSLESEGLPKDVFAPSERERLVQAMAAACAERGYAQTTVEEVVERAGVSRQAFAMHFAGKEECALAAIKQILSESTAVASAGYSADTSAWESILRGVKAMLDLLTAQPALARMGYIESRQAMPHRAFELYESGFQVMASMLDRLRVYSPGGALPATAARAALGGAEAMVRREIAAGRSDRLPELLPNIIYGTLVPFLGQEEALRNAGLARELLNDGGRE